MDKGLIVADMPPGIQYLLAWDVIADQYYICVNSCLSVDAQEEAIAKAKEAIEDRAFAFGAVNELRG